MWCKLKRRVKCYWEIRPSMQILKTELPIAKQHPLMLVCQRLMSLHY